jgi:hypothetical protein
MLVFRLVNLNLERFDYSDNRSEFKQFIKVIEKISKLLIYYSTWKDSLKLGFEQLCKHIQCWWYCWRLNIAKLCRFGLIEYYHGWKIYWLV